MGVPPQNSKSAPEPIPEGMASCNAQYVNASPTLTGAYATKFREKLEKIPHGKKRDSSACRSYDHRGDRHSPRTEGHITEGPIQDRVIEDTLAFSEEDFETLTQPHNAALIILTSRVLNDFNMAGEVMKVEITLPVVMSGTVQNTKFYIISSDVRYNALLGRPWIHNMREVPSTLHQMMKFPTKEGIKTVYGEHHAAKEMFAVHWEASNPIHSTSEVSRSVQTLEGDEEDFLTPRTFVAPKESDATMSTIEELE
uniref:Uncharacterized protein n=1 Tax=Nicotiana tabacum TaxID=4097 RepID=A0A1S3YXW3_TOBAC|nr:PREDICTED: uncharacterized protein LOC107780840 [Nicotiana tabacum]